MADRRNHPPRGCKCIGVVDKTNTIYGMILCANMWNFYANYSYKKTTINHWVKA